MQALRSRIVLAVLLCAAAAAGCAHKKPLLRWEPQPASATLEGAVRVGAVRNLRPADYGADNPNLLGYSRSGPGIAVGKRHLDRPYLATDADSYEPATVEASLRRLVEGSLLAAGIQAHSEHPNAEVSIDLKALWVDGYSSFFGANGEMDVVISDLEGHELRRLPLQGKADTSMGWQWTPLEELMNRFQQTLIAAFRDPATRETLLEPDKVSRRVPPTPKTKPAATGSADVAKRLKDLKSLRDQGLISEEDYQKKKKEILDSM